MTCETCGGKGRATCGGCGGKGTIGHGARCHRCVGTRSEPCPTCRGRGHTPSGHREPDGDESTEKATDHDADNRR